jgi:hypothetical protein
LASVVFMGNLRFQKDGLQWRTGGQVSKQVARVGWAALA